MQYLNKHLCSAAARLGPGRALIVAMLLGPLVGALLAFGAVAAQDANVVMIDNFTFSPKELTIAVGTTVKFVNHDDIPHTVVERISPSARRRSTPTTRIPTRSPRRARSIISAVCIRIWSERSSSSERRALRFLA